jgi:hypothetical protein
MSRCRALLRRAASIWHGNNKSYNNWRRGQGLVQNSHQSPTVSRKNLTFRPVDRRGAAVGRGAVRTNSWYSLVLAYKSWGTVVGRPSMWTLGAARQSSHRQPLACAHRSTLSGRGWRQRSTCAHPTGRSAATQFVQLISSCPTPIRHW